MCVRTSYDLVGLQIVMKIFIVLALTLPYAWAGCPWGTPTLEKLTSCSDHICASDKAMFCYKENGLYNCCPRSSSDLCPKGKPYFDPAEKKVKQCKDNASCPQEYECDLTWKCCCPTSPAPKQQSPPEMMEEMQEYLMEPMEMISQKK